MPGADRQKRPPMVETIGELLKINNQFYSNAPLSIALGFATSEPGETIEAMVRRADLGDVRAERAHYADRKALNLMVKNRSRQQTRRWPPSDIRSDISQRAPQSRWAMPS